MLLYIQNIYREAEIVEYSLFEQMTKKEDFTDNEIKQASLYRDYLSSSKTNNELESFLRKAIKNNMADKMAEYREQQSEADYQERKRSLIYVD